MHSIFVGIWCYGSLSPDLYKELEEIAQEEGKTVSAVIREALRIAKRKRLKLRFLDTQKYCTRKAKKRGFSPKGIFRNFGQIV
ncbi:MAG: CopG family transcriptional regulator [Nitrospirales bacterium]|nr:CopG family transcriptional regulator [Nitrospirales bacterium]